MPVPYQVELFDALSASEKIELTVLYSLLQHSSRSWITPKIAHEYRVEGELNEAAARLLVERQDLVVFSGYHPRSIRSLIAHRDQLGKPWAFWGEKPGTILPGWLGRYYRALLLPELTDKQVPIWGIGAWAVAAYRSEYGQDRDVVNIPYFSDLKRFLQIDRLHSRTPVRRFLFSGSFIKRKGVDLLMKAFVALAQEVPNVELDLIGDGPLRPQLEKMSRPIVSQVHFHGFRQWEELPKYYAKADVLCAPSCYDGWGLIIPEGLASGLLVVSTNRTGAALDLVDTQTGWVVPAGQWEPLFEVMRAATLVSPDERISRIRRGRESVAPQDLSSGVDRVLSAIDDSLAHWSTAGQTNSQIESQ